ncbi:hypothetical protein B296_00001290 [Ensete ventricosum]|uniref:Uncharacterized protein n=1 Tax=Ensete ventricosum TaxID=4639 RepID=A0A427B0N7_ENSVE|nr:hypothetical protein B296_00001290 [Ensete ventricosum]
MARGAVEWGRGSGSGGKFCCSFKRITVVVCCVNLVAAFLVLRTFYTSFSLVSSSDPFSGTRMDPVFLIQDSVRVRRDSEPVELVRAVSSQVRKLRKELLKEEKKVLKLLQPVKQKLANEILQKLQSVKDNNVTEQRGGWSFSYDWVC